MSADPLDTPDRMWDTLARYVTGACSAEEREAVQGWLSRQPGRAEFAAALAEASRRVTSPGQVDVEMALRRVRARLSESGVRSLEARLRAEPAAPRRRARLLIAAGAAVLLVGVALAWGLLN